MVMIREGMAIAGGLMGAPIHWRASRAMPYRTCYAPNFSATHRPCIELSSR